MYIYRYRDVESLNSLKETPTQLHLLSPTVVKRFAQQLFDWYEGVIGYYSCYHHNPLPSPTSLPSLQGDLENIEISHRQKTLFFTFSSLTD